MNCLPGGCSFHPRCPYVRERHRKVEPKLEPTGGQDAHLVRCLLDSTTGRGLWGELQKGKLPDAARASVKLEETV